MKVLNDIIAFKWIKPKTNQGLVMKDSFYDLNIRPAKIHEGEVLRVGDKVKNFKKGDRFLIEEYSLEIITKEWEEDKEYYVREKEIKIKLLEPINGFIRIIPSEEWNKVK